MPSENFEVPLLQRAKSAALVAIVLTSICSLAVLGWQLALAVAGAGWTPLSVGQVLENAEQTPRHYVTASGEQVFVLEAAPLLDWVLDLPAIFVLVSALGLVAVYYVWLKSLEKTVLGL